MTHSPHVHFLPADPDQLNGKRSHWAGLALTAFQAATNTDDEDVLCDLLTDLMHWADRHSFDFEAAMARAEDHYSEETRSCDESPPPPEGPNNALSVASEPFDYRPGTDGTESTFDVIHLPTNSVIGSFAYWEAEADAKQHAVLLVRGLNSLHRNGYVHRRTFRTIVGSAFESHF